MGCKIAHIEVNFKLHMLNYPYVLHHLQLYDIMQITILE
jgi:hypothetical protein